MTPPRAEVRTPLDRPLVIGHRGSPRTHAENTLAGLRHALQQGADGVEFDVRMAADGVPILAHDADLRRTHKERVPVAGLPADRLPLPTMAEILEGLAEDHRGALLDIELKTMVPTDTIGDLLAGVAWEGPVIITSFHVDTVRSYHQAGWTTGLLVDDRRTQAEDIGPLLDISQADLLAVRNPVFLGSLERVIHERDAGLWVWTLNRRSHLKRAKRKGVDAVITDLPEKAVGVLAGDGAAG